MPPMMSVPMLDERARIWLAVNVSGPRASASWITLSATCSSLGTLWKTIPG